MLWAMNRLASMSAWGIRRGRTLLAAAALAIYTLAWPVLGQDSGVTVMAQVHAAEPDAAAPSPRRGIGMLWHNGDLVTRTTLLALLLMAVGSGYIVASRYREQAVVLRHAKTLTDFWTAPNLYQAVQSLERGSAFRKIAEDGLEAAAHREGKLTDSVALDEWIERSLARSIATVDKRLQRGLVVLSAVASTAPIVGLVGTLWGICQTLLAIGAGTGHGRSTTASFGEALMITALGLAVAVPASLGHNWLAHRNGAATERLRDFAADIRAVLRSTDAAVAAETTPR